jgi:hypothetical protein
MIRNLSRTDSWPRQVLFAPELRIERVCAHRAGNSIPWERRLSQRLSVRIKPKDRKALTLGRATILRLNPQQSPAGFSSPEAEPCARGSFGSLHGTRGDNPEPPAEALGDCGSLGVFRVWTHITRYIPPRGFESIMEALAGDLAEFPRWRRSGVNSNRPRMRASGHGKGQKQRSHRNPFLHVLILTFLLSPFLRRENCMLSKPAAAGFVARKIGSCNRDQSSRKQGSSFAAAR